MAGADAGVKSVTGDKQIKKMTKFTEKKYSKCTLEELFEENHKVKIELDKFRKKYGTKRLGQFKLLQKCLYKKYGFFVPLKYNEGKEHEFWRLLKVIIKGVAIQSRIGERRGKNENI